MNRRLRAFTLIELLTVVAIITLLAALLLPTLKEARYKAKLAVCKNNQRQIYAAIQMYGQDYNRRLPLGDPHGGYGGMETSSGYTVTTYTAGTNTFLADGLPLRHVYRNLGQLWATRYLTRGVLQDPDFLNEIDTLCISYRGRPNWRSLYTTPSLNTSTWSTGTYVFYSWSYRPGIRGDAVRVLDWNQPLTTGLVQCRIAGFNMDGTQKRLGGHDRKALNCLYEDGHVSTLYDVQRELQREWAQLPAGYGYHGNENSVWARWWGDFIKNR